MDTNSTRAQHSTPGAGADSGAAPRWIAGRTSFQVTKQFAFFAFNFSFFIFSLTFLVQVNGVSVTPPALPL